MNVFVAFMDAGVGWLLQMAGEMLKSMLPPPRWPPQGLAPARSRWSKVMEGLARAATRLADWLIKLSERLRRSGKVFAAYAERPGELESLRELLDDLKHAWET